MKRPQLRTDRPASTRRRERGVALLLVLLIIAVVATMQIETQYTTRIDAQIAANVALDTQFYYLAKSGIEAARSLLTEDRRDNAFDATTETWAAPIAYPVDEALVSLSLVDEERKFPINALIKRTTTPQQGGQPAQTETQVDEELYNVFTSLLESLEIPAEVAPALVDWLDPDDDPYGGDGAEINFYERLKPPYKTKNGPLSTLDELRMVRGIDAKVFRVLADLVTPYVTEPKININTAPKELLTVLLPEADSSLMDELIQKRTDEPFQKPSEVGEYLKGFGASFPDERLAALEKLFRTDSNHFTISSSASLIPEGGDEEDGNVVQAQNLKLLHAVVRRNNDGITELIYWRAT
ncbi:MAG: type II secretion system minor pseudopilin GspK [Deltaproteobacteria bacterium]|nr:type II secretion system minor pseudopilin GspK [Deltaproteobacteria bacterium]